MLTVLLLTLVFLRTQGAPLLLSTGLETDPTIAHTILFGIQPRSDGSEANMRTLYEIVRSCLFTIAACVYRAIHQNIPDPTMTMWGRLRVRAKITIYALIAPEAMIWWAMRQRYGAIEIANQVKELKCGLNWTQTHGHFAQMGGFARKDNKHVLYPATLIELLQQGWIDPEELQLTKEDIDDKSKGDILSKTLVAFQTTWFVFECITRLHQKLPLIELEVVTLAFAILNVITYALWWYKPLNVLRPIYLRIRETPEKWHPVPMDYVEDEPGWWKRIWKGSLLALMSMPVLELFEIGSGEKGAGMVARETTEDTEWRGWWTTLWEWLIKKPFLAVAWPLRELFVDEEVHSRATHVSTFYGMDVPDDKFSLVQRLSCLVGVIFGGIHFLSWHSPFPTHSQLLLWRISSIILVAQPVSLFLGFIFSTIADRTPSRSWRRSIAEFFQSFFALLSIFVGPIPYVLARFCLLVLAFLTLNDLPPHALDAIAWTSYIPHL
ncbi:hypothetical protein BDN72DRAFT_965704 [Pluteus cervinus]|uniref:Uncharacterized protein n=1 Tax=Pluteus cervinus TaxID=181527 RepID=A0ACD3A3Z6_9AGAR|nr:hypothetical protein BDN72DRAFT_965704 [Pluteus cervinus]